MQISGACSIVILTSHSPANYALINSLRQKHSLKLIVFEQQALGRFTLFFKRLAKLGFVTVANQMLFKILDIFLFQRRAQRMAPKLLGHPTIFDRNGLIETRITDVSNINSRQVEDLVSAIEADVVVVSGTSILGPKLLRMFGSTPVINIHCGITPAYRGNHGAFWAIVNGDWENIGTTVHFVDSGIDTGAIIKQVSIPLEPDDDPRTIGLKQYATGIRLLSEVIPKICAGDKQILKPKNINSHLYSSPTLTSYLQFRRRMKERFSHAKSNRAERL